MKPWHEQDEFWVSCAPTLFAPRIIRQAKYDIKNIINLLGLEPEQSILDLGCGIGRHALAFAKAGFKVTAVDRTAELLRRARESAKKENVIIHFVHRDMREYRRSEYFDVVINLYATFGFFKKISDDKLVLDNIYASLRSGGRLVMQLAGEDRIKRVLAKRRTREGSFLYGDLEINKSGNWIKYTIPSQVGSDIRIFKVGERIYSANSMCSLLGKVGFCDIQVYSDFLGSRRKKSDYMVFVAKKPHHNIM